MIARNGNQDIRKQKVGTFANTLPIPLPNGTIYQMPVPYGIWRLGFTPGAIAARYFSGDGKDQGEDSINLVRNMFSENLSPVKPPIAQHSEKFGDMVLDFLQAAEPTAASAPLDLARNNNSFCQKIISDR